MKPDVRLVLIKKGSGRASIVPGIDLKQLTAGETPHHYYESWDRALRESWKQSEKISHLRHARLRSRGWIAVRPWPVTSASRD